MEWNAAIEENRGALKRILAMLLAMAGLAGAASFTSPLWGGRREGSGGGCALATTPSHEEETKPAFPATLPRRLHRAVLRLLRPAEAAARRLIIVMARGLVVALPPLRPRGPRPRPVDARRAGRAGMRTENLTARAATLPLFDPLRAWPRRARPTADGVPRISVPGFGKPFPIAVRRPPSDDDPVSTLRLARRLAALAAALDDLPALAGRFARWRARALDGTARSRSRGRLWPLRPGRPPGSRRKPVHEVHEVLNTVHGLAIWALEPPDTS